MKPLTVFVVSAILALVSITASGEPLPAANPDQVGLSSQRLERIGQLLKTDVDKGKIPGAVALVGRKGRVAYFEAFGSRGQRNRGAHDQGRDIPDLLHDKAGHVGRCSDARGGRGRCASSPTLCRGTCPHWPNSRSRFLALTPAQAERRTTWCLPSGL